jgi:hypothetical protein
MAIKWGNMVTRAARLEEFIINANPPTGAVVQLLCEDHVGTYLLPYLCECTIEGYQNRSTGELIEARVVGWRMPRASEGSPVSEADVPLPALR